MKLLVALALALLATPAVPQTPSTVPIDIAARAKFKRSVPEQVDAIAAVNRLVNESIRPEEDKAHYGIDELWVMYPPDSKGDCEDYALTKLGVLSRAGFPIIPNTKIVGVIVTKDGKNLGGHAILAVRLPSGEVAYLDNRFPEPMTRKELVARGYAFFDWRA